MNEVNRCCGVIPEIEPMRMYDYERACGKIEEVKKETSYPEEFMIEKKYLGVLKNQGNVGACVACVMSSLAEVFELIEQTNGEDLSDEDFEKLLGAYEFSEGWAYAALRDSNDTGYGMYPTVAINNWSKRGMVLKKSFDYLEEVPNILEVVKKFPELDKEAEPYRIQNYVTLSYANLEKRDLAIKEFLMSHGYGILAVSDRYFGESHCIMVVGWNDKTNCYKIKNSWGTYWGDQYGVKEIPKKAINKAYGILDTEIVPPFKDVKKDDWFYKAVKNMFFSGLLQGVTDTEFAPLQETTRGEMATIIERIINLTFERIKLALKVSNETHTVDIESIMQRITSVSNKKNPFVDVAPDSWYYYSIKHCFEWGIITGQTANQFGPEDAISRAEVAAICVRTCNFIVDKLALALESCGKKNVPLSTLTQVINSELPTYLDVTEKDSEGNDNWYFNYVNKAYQFDIMKGIDNNLFEPERNVNRAEIATILNRLTKFLDIKNNILVEIF